MRKESLQQEDTSIISRYKPNIRIPKYIKQILRDLEEEIYSNTIIVVDFNTPLSITNRPYTENQEKGRLINPVYKWT